MAFNVQSFRSSMTSDGARPNLFEVQLMGGPGFTLGNQFTFKCKGSAIPGSTIGTVTTQYFGREVKFAGNRTFADWNVTLYNDEDFQVRSKMEFWMNQINSHAGNLRLSGNAPSSYTTDAMVIHYGKSGDVLRTYQIIGLFPTDVAQIDLDWSTNDTIEEYSVTFAYQYWQAIGKAGVPIVG